MTDWRTLNVKDCLLKARLESNVKLQTEDYRPSGRFPVVDQGQQLIAGWTDDDRGVIGAGLPYIVFGDHTRALKFVDFPFVRGADGTQILKPTDDINPLFFYYALRALDLPSRGYNRHFSILKEKEIRIAEESEQSAVARTLKLAEDAVEVQAREITGWQSLKHVVTRELFTKGLRGKAQRDTEIGPVPANWELVSISDLGQVVTGNTPPTKDEANYTNGDILFVAPGDIEHGCRIQITAKHITDKGLSTVRPIPIGATCFVCIGSTIGKVGFLSEELAATNQQINSIVPSSDFEPQYVFYLMTYWSDHVRRQASPSPVPIISKGAFERVGIYSSKDQGEQREIVAVLDAIDRKIDLHKRKRVVLDELFKALLHKLMTGEIRVADLDLSALEPVKETEAAA